MRKKALTALAIAVLLTGAGCVLFVKLQLRSLHADVITHLERQGYQKKDIASAKPRFAKQPVFGVTITFQDEPRVAYMYSKDNGVLLQKYHTSISNYSYKHLEK